MNDIFNLLNKIADREKQLQSTQFIAPCVKGGKVRTKVDNIIYTFTPKGRKFEGWGIFQPKSDRLVKMIREADLFQISTYLEQFKSFRLRLAYNLQGKTWLAYPVSEADFKQRIGKIKPIPVHLVTEGTTFEQILVRWDGNSWWFEELDRRADLEVVEELQNDLQQNREFKELSFKGMTPEMRTVYQLVTQKIKEFSQEYREEKLLKSALKMGGGNLEKYHDRGDYWTVEWQTSDGEYHYSAISKQDLTVISSGICLSDRDRDFDLQSLVGVIENRY